MHVGVSAGACCCLQVREEAGLDCEPISLLLIQEQGPQWIRFVFLARVTGQRSLIPGWLLGHHWCYWFSKQSEPSVDQGHFGV